MTEQNYNEEFQPQETPQQQVFGAQPQVAPQQQVFGGQPQEAPQQQVFGAQPQVAPQQQVFGGQPQEAPQQQVFGGQPQVAPQQQVFGGQQQVIPQAQMKKPMKLGWIISLTLFAISVIAMTVGGVLTMSNTPTNIANDLDPKIERFLAGKEESGFISNVDFSVSDNGFTYKGLTKGKAYVFVLWQTSDEMAENIKFDNETVTPFLNDYPNSKTIDSRKIKNRKYYYVVAKGSEMNITMDNIRSTSGRISLNETREVTSRVEMFTAGIVLLVIFSITTLMALIATVIFFVFYILKNNKYKASQQLNY